MEKQWTRKLADEHVREFRREVLEELDDLREAFKSAKIEEIKNLKRKRIH